MLLCVCKLGPVALQCFPHGVFTEQLSNSLQPSLPFEITTDFQCCADMRLVLVEKARCVVYMGHTRCQGSTASSQNFSLSSSERGADVTSASIVLSNTSPGHYLQVVATWRGREKVTLIPPKRLSSTSELMVLVR